jgi:hypothetical protein
LRYGGLREPGEACPSFGLRRSTRGQAGLEVLVFADPQPKSRVDVDYYRRDIVERLQQPDGRWTADMGLTLGDVVSDDLSLYPAMNAVTATLGVPWLHVAGNHDVDTDATRDEDALLTFRNTYGPDTLAWTSSGNSKSPAATRAPSSRPRASPTASRTSRTSSPAWCWKAW